MFGYGFGLSDIRVTLGSGAEADCLQKIYPVARWVAAGFSGSVQIGFALIDSLSRWGNAIEERYAMVPAVLAREWPTSARKIFARFPENERAATASILTISTDPQEDSGNPNWPLSYVHIFRSPDFQPG
jgi:hypothetical protein